MNLQPFLDFTQELAHESARVILPYYGHECELEWKADDSPVTIADREAERVMRGLIEKRFPDHGIIGEEMGNDRPDAEWVWILDPIDGTKSFISGVPLFGTLIGLLHDGKPVVGCINQPVLNQLLIGDNARTTLNGKPVRARSTPTLKAATVLTTDPLRPHQCRDGRAYDRVACAAGMLRTWGDCYGYLLVSCGFADVMLDPRMASWDLLPLLPCVRGAGALVSDWNGNEIAPLNPDAPEAKSYSCVAAVPELHTLVVEMLNS
jgi:myo-inositol-1(or 4)-monophosphatase